MKPSGYVLYRGPSQLTDEPIVMVAILHSHNGKTGDVVQTYILADGGERPTEALRSGGDSAICGDCKHKFTNAGTCYVVVRQGATRVWQALQNGNYPDVTRKLETARHLFAGRMIRMGTYGDPAAVPFGVWRAILTAAKSWIGYTHQWTLEAAQPLREYCMASVDTPTEKGVANARGWRTFRVRLADEHLLHSEAVCPASDEAGHKLQCLTCGACNGAQDSRKGNIAIIVHGAPALDPINRFIDSRNYA